MRISTRGLDLIKIHEGFRSKAYPDPGSRDGKPWTIGYGHTKGVKKGDIITKAQAEAFLRQDVRNAESFVTKKVSVPLNQNQFDALVSFVFNVGNGAFSRSTMLRKLNAEDYKGAAQEFGRWNKNDGRVMSGLTKRRSAERACFESGETPKSAAEMVRQLKRPVNHKKPSGWQRFKKWLMRST